MVKYKWRMDAWNKIQCEKIDYEVNPKKMNRLMYNLTMITYKKDPNLFKEAYIKRLKGRRKYYFREITVCEREIKEVEANNK